MSDIHKAMKHLLICTKENKLENNQDNSCYEYSDLKNVTCMDMNHTNTEDHRSGIAKGGNSS